MNGVYIIAEIGCNHNGDKELAKKMVDEAVKAGVNAVKFQTFNTKALISKYAPKAQYQIQNTGDKDTQLEMTQKLELSKSDFLELKEYALKLGVDVFSTPFDMESIDFLYEKGQRVWKIPSGEITNLPYIKKIADLQCKDKRILLSSGMATIDELRRCVEELLAGGMKKEEIILLHCNTEYPTPDCDVNLTAILDLKQNFPGMLIGFSDHSVGSVAAIGAVALGAVMIEKHFTLDKNMEGPDHKASATPEELKELCCGVRRMEKMAGNGKKYVTESEKKNKIVARKSVVALRDIKAGEILTEENITCKRPGNGISPMEWYNLLGKIAERDFEMDELITMTGFSWQED